MKTNLSVSSLLVNILESIAYKTKLVSFQSTNKESMFCPIYSKPNQLTEGLLAINLVGGQLRWTQFNESGTVTVYLT